MKRRFTKLMAALALLVLVALPAVGWGQTRETATDVMNQTWTGVTGTNYTQVTGLEGSASDAVYTVQCAGGNSSIQLRSSNNNSGIVSTTSGGTVTKVTVTWQSDTQNGRTLNVYGSNSAYSTPSDLYGNNAGTLIGTIVKGTSTELTITDSYAYIGMRSASGAMYLTEIDVTWSTGGSSGPTTYTVTYDANGGTGTMVDGNSPYEAGVEVTLLTNTFTAPEGKIWDSWEVKDADDNDITVSNGKFTMPANNVTVKAQWVDDPATPQINWILTNLADLTTDDVFVIVGNNGSNYAMSNDKGTGSAPAAVAVTVANDAITGTVAANIQWNISGNATDGYTFYPNGSTETWLYCTNTNNGVRVGTNTSKTFVINSDYLYHSGTNRHVGIYSSQDWRCYSPQSGNVHSNISGQTFAFYKKVTGGVVPPSITANNVEIEYNVTEGAIEYTINNGVEGGLLTAATESDWLTLGDDFTSPIAFACSANETATDRTATVTLTYTYGDSQTATKNVTVTQTGDPNYTPTIAEVRAQGTGAVVTQGIVTSCVGTTGYIQDATAAICVYGESLTVGDEIRVSGTLSDYNGLLEITSPVVTVLSSGNTIEPELMTIAEVVASTNQGWYIRIENATVTAINGKNVTIAQGESNVVVRFASEDDITFEVNDVISLNGNIGAYNGVQIANPQNVEVQAAPAEPSITLISNDPVFTPNSPYTIEFTHESGGGSSIDQVQCENFSNTLTVDDFSILYCDAEGNALESQEAPVWFLSAPSVTSESNNLYLGVTVNVNTSATAHTCYFKVGAANGTDMVYSDLVTVYQAGYVATITVDPTVVNATAAETDGTITVTYTNIDFTNAPEIVFYSDAEGTIEVEASYYEDWFQAEINSDNNVDYLIGANDGEARTAYFKVYGLDIYVQEVYSDLVTVNQAEYVVDYATLPFEWEGGMPNAFDALNGTTLNSVGSYPNQTTYQMKLDADGDYIQVKCDQQPGVVSFGVKMVGGNATSSIVVKGSTDGETFTDVQTFEISGNQNSIHNFETTNDFASNDRYVRLYFSKGTGSNVGVGPISIAKVDNTPRITLSYYNTNEHPFTPEDPYMIVFPNVAAGGYIDQIEYVNFPNALNVNDFTIQFYDAEDQVISQPDWIELAQVSLVDENFILQVQTYGNDSEARTAYFKVGAYLTVTEVVYSDLVTVTQEAYVAPFEPTIYTRVTTIVPGEHYIIVSFNGDESFAMGDQVNNYRQSVAISADGTNATVVNEDVFDFVIQSEGNNYTIYDSRNAGYLCAVSSNNNSIGFQTTNDDNGVWSISMEADGEATVAAQGEYTRNHLRYNTNTPRFSCYAETSSVDTKVYFYVKSDMAPATYTLNINGYANDDVKDGYYLIASPVYVNPATVEGMTTDDFDLYYYDDAEELEWRNYEETPFSLVPGKGYLYAKKATVENPTYSFDLTGVPYDGQGEFNLTAGWNLVGNPFGQTAYIEGEFYAMNEEGSEIMTNASTGAVAVMQGVFVLAGEEGEIITFTPQAPQKKAGLALNLISNRSNVIDRAIVRFGEGRQLPKFQLNPNNTKLYISQGNNDYAVVRSAAYGEMPVNFKAQSNGTYTLSVNPENVEMTYLHLIDNLTGADVDLLVNPSYTFEAKTSDYASRFRLVFNANNSTSENAFEPFAFFNGDSWTVSNMGEATLQVVDMLGRIISSETINGNATVSTANLSTGVYVMRLVNGENLKTQKVVVK